MRVINFGHPFTSANIDEIVNLVKQKYGDVNVSFEEKPVQVDLDGNVETQMSDLVADIKERKYLVVNLPGLSIAASLLTLILLHRVMGLEIVQMVRRDGPIRFSAFSLIAVTGFRPNSSLN